VRGETTTDAFHDGRGCGRFLGLCKSIDASKPSAAGTMMHTCMYGQEEKGQRCSMQTPPLGRPFRSNNGKIRLTILK